MCDGSSRKLIAGWWWVRTCNDEPGSYDCVLQRFVLVSSVEQWAVETPIGWIYYNVFNTLMCLWRADVLIELHMSACFPKLYIITRTMHLQTADLRDADALSCAMNNFLIMSLLYSSCTTFLLLISLCIISRYTILFTSIIQISLAMWAMSSRGGAEAFISMWSSIVLLILCIGGTIIMRKFQSSVFVGFFMGSVVAASQMFFMLFLM